MRRGIALIACLAGCSPAGTEPDTGDQPGCNGAKCDEADEVGEEILTADVVEGTVEGSNLACDLLNRSTAPNRRAENLRRNFGKFLHDPVAELILRNGPCPNTFADVMRKLDEVEPGCRNRSAIVSETAHASRNDDSVEVDYRAVTTRFDAETSTSCLTVNADGTDEVEREPHELLFSTFGYAVGAPVPMNAEFIGFDRTRGVFNYYTLDPVTDEDGNPIDKDGEIIDLEEEGALERVVGEWAYFGDSEQYARIYRDRLNQKTVGPFDGFFSEEQLEEAQADAANAELPRCAVCHTGGGLLMKELDNPWLHWDTDRTMPGVAELFAETGEVLGGSLSAPELERVVVKPGNEAWNTDRINNILEAGDPIALLTPLFCTVEVNLQTGDRSAEGGVAVSNWPDFLVNPRLLEARATPPGLALDGFRLGSSSYDKAVDELGQGIGSLGIADTFKRFVYTEVSHADNDYIAQLEAASLLSSDFVEDVLAVDVTRPVFSDERCFLLEHVPADLEIPADVRERGLSAPVAQRRKLRDAIEEAVLASLEETAETDGELALLDNMNAEGTPVLDEGLVKLGQSCQARAVSNANAFHVDMLRVAAARRHITRHDVRFIEFDGTMPGDEFWGFNNATERDAAGGLAPRDVFFNGECRIDD